MSYEFFFQKFENGKAGVIPFEEINAILKNYGEIIGDDSDLEFVSKVGEICERACLFGESRDAISGMVCFRPVQHELLPKIIFDLLSIENTCFFGPGLDYLQARTDISSQLPESLLEGAESGLQIIDSAYNSWPFP
ncbi:hypothetical protein EUZ85_23415 [Hahella sp. KA22]|uniref:hypothetical protein n=1 Tax=Hahella sp. KA22 TaxID=1628392 RepID=UPI000FDE9D7F|nr:hypothetical protein [Hahella sp. KA22]AZZ93510.1 hypothetical protein ENC22_20830 [Hahella sp. KA22]QAY56885.1 hypothetical protein EUZ85_23415 [Hahella sp. KA22]